MARKRSGLLEDMVEIAARLPWWVSVLLAAVGYAGLHLLATQEVAAPTGVAGLGAIAGKRLMVTLATVFQYVIPACFLIGALVSTIKSRRGRALHESVRIKGDSSALFEMNWREFEQMVGEHFRRLGFSVTESGGGGPDGGRDLVLRKGKDKYLVQCKQWRATKVGVEVVRELFGVMAAEGAVGGYVVSGGSFTDDARKFADGRNIELVDGKQLAADIAQDPALTSSTAGQIGDPACPECGARMARRVARKGSNAGSVFWGCMKYPDCRGTRAVAN